jgi:hypothetical protein
LVRGDGGGEGDENDSDRGYGRANAGEVGHVPNCPMKERAGRGWACCLGSVASGVELGEDQGAEERVCGGRSAGWCPALLCLPNFLRKFRVWDRLEA